MAFPVLDLCFGVVGVSVLPFYVIRLLVGGLKICYSGLGLRYAI